MKKLIAFFFLAAGCYSLFAQQSLLNENFDNLTVPDLPVGWSTSTVWSIGFRTELSNSSAGYTNASGVNNVVIRNTDSTGTYTLYSPVISTLGYTGIQVSWASRVSTNFTASNSTMPSLQYTTDSGATWNSVTYTDNDANSVWALVNGGVPIYLPAACSNAASLRLRWVINIVNNANGTYRFDDISVAGNLINGVEEVASGISIWPNPSTTMLHFSETVESFVIRDMTGKEILRNSFPMQSQVEITSLDAGVYFLSHLKNGSYRTVKFIKE